MSSQKQFKKPAAPATTQHAPGSGMINTWPTGAPTMALLTYIHYKSVQSFRNIYGHIWYTETTMVRSS